MPVEYIPNQPLSFIDNLQVGLNNDSTVHNVLMVADDRLYIQHKLAPCGGLNNCPFGIAGTNLMIGVSSFDDGAGGSGLWTDNSPVSIDHAGSANNWISGATNAAVKVFSIIKITFTVTSASGGTVTPYQETNAATSGRNVGQPVSALGTYVQYMQAALVGKLLAFNAVDTIKISSQYSYQILWECYNITGFFPSDDFTLFRTPETIGGLAQIWSNNAPFTAGNYHQIKVKFTNITQGVINIYHGLLNTYNPTTDLIGSITTNGDYTFYYQNNTLVNREIWFVTEESFLGSISNLEIFDFNITNDIGYLITTDNNVPQSAMYSTTSVIDPIVIYRDYFTWSVAFSNVTNLGNQISLATGCYKIQLIDLSCGATDIISSFNSIKYNTSEFEKTKMITGDCNNEAFNFNFTQTGFKLQQRLPILQINPNYKTDAEGSYLSDGNKRNFAVRSEKQKTMWIDYIDEIAHDCLRLIVNCDTTTIDDTEYYFPPQDYEPEWTGNQKYNLAQVKLDIQLQGQVLYNK